MHIARTSKCAGWESTAIMKPNDISKCTDLLEMFTRIDTEHYKYMLQDTPIWASPDDATIFKQENEQIRKDQIC